MAENRLSDYQTDQMLGKLAEIVVSLREIKSGIKDLVQVIKDKETGVSYIVEKKEINNGK